VVECILQAAKRRCHGNGLDAERRRGDAVPVE
jgi:hypothetical protein